MPAPAKSWRSLPRKPAISEDLQYSQPAPQGRRPCEAKAGCDSCRSSDSLALSAATACSWAEQAFAAGGDNGNESFESRFLCNVTTLCYTIDLWRTDIQVLVYIIENRGAKWLMVLTGAECDKVPAREVIDACLAHEGTCHFPTPWPLPVRHAVWTGTRTHRCCVSPSNRRCHTTTTAATAGSSDVSGRIPRKDVKIVLKIPPT